MKEKGKRNAKDMIRIVGRILSEMVKDYKWQTVLVVACIIGSSLATLRGTLFMQRLIDDYILPLT